MTRGDKKLEICNMPEVHEDKLEKAFVRAINKSIYNKETFAQMIIEDVEKVIL